MIESMVRIQHGFWSKRSEADLLEGSERSCNAGWDFKPALEFIKKKKEDPGLAETSCNIYYDYDRPYLGCADRAGRALTLGDYVPLETIEDQKWWPHTVGPITCALDVYEDFQVWKPADGVYIHEPVEGEEPGGHALLIVGYDDEKECWIVKNSWGPKWGDQGYIEVG